MAIELAVANRSSPEVVFDRVISLGWYDGPLSGMLRCGESEFRFDMVDDADVLRFRIFTVAPLPSGSEREFINSMRRCGLLSRLQRPPKMLWTPIWQFPSDEQRIAAEEETDAIIATAAPIAAAFCWDMHEWRIIAYREVPADSARPADWFEWLGIDRPEPEDD